MAKGDCKRRTIRFAKRGAKFLGAALGPVIPQVVSAIEDLLPMLGIGALSGHTKRRMVFDAVAQKAKEIGHDAFDVVTNGLTSRAEGYVRAALESALENLRLGQPLAKLEAWASDPDLIENDAD